MVITMKSFQSCKVFLPLYGHWDPIFVLRMFFFAAYYLYQKALRHLGGRWGVGCAPLHPSSISALGSLQCSRLKVVEYESLKRKCLKVAEYIYHRMVVTLKASKSYKISIPMYGHCKESVLKM